MCTILNEKKNPHRLVQEKKTNVVYIWSKWQSLRKIETIDEIDDDWK